MTLELSHFIKTISKFISNFFNPITSLIIYFVYFSFQSVDPLAALKSLIPLVLVLILPISLWIFYNVKTGRYTNMDVSNRQQRHSLYIVLIVLLTIYLLYHYFINNTIDYLLGYLAVLLVLMQISNFFIKSSMHTALNIYVAALFFKLNPTLGLLWFILSIIIGITRVILKRHTVAEVISGAILGTAIGLAYINF